MRLKLKVKKLKLSQHFIKHHILKACMGVAVQLLAFFPMALNRGKWSASHPSHLTPCKIAPHIHLTRYWVTPGPVWRLWRRNIKSLALAKDKTSMPWSTVQPVVHNLSYPTSREWIWIKAGKVLYNIKSELSQRLCQIRFILSYIKICTLSNRQSFSRSPLAILSHWHSNRLRLTSTFGSPITLLCKYVHMHWQIFAVLQTYDL